MKPMKFKVNNEEHSRIVQEVLFNLGYRWVNHGKNVANTHVPYLYTDIFSEGNMEFDPAEEKDSFEEEEAREIDVSWMDPELHKEREIVEFNGKRYDKADLEKALKLIEPVE